MNPIFGQRLFPARRCICNQGANLRTGFEQPCSLAADNLEIGFFGNVRFTRIDQLQQFTLGNIVGRIGDHIQNVQALRFHQ